MLAAGEERKKKKREKEKEKKTFLLFAFLLRAPSTVTRTITTPTEHVGVAERVRGEVRKGQQDLQIF